jgi:chromosome segregation ATPase
MKLIVWLLVAALAVVLVMINWPQDDRPKIDPKLQRSLDSSDVTRPGFEARVDTLRLRAAADTARARALEAKSHQMEQVAARARRRADSLAATNTEWQAAYAARTEEADTLRSIIVVKDSTIDSERAGRLKVQRIADEEKARRLSLESLNGGLRSTIATLERPCRRTVSVLSALGGYLAGSVAPAPIRH